ncbi:MAG: hypothetical protein AWU54_427 [Candidatus Frackibacter sp. T328-2]|nr:MAG: hypothetical protein AWU54_427 [Candidatus Frackibacter sp. T328-2]
MFAPDLKEECVICGEEIEIDHERIMIIDGDKLVSVCMSCEGRINEWQKNRLNI